MTDKELRTQIKSELKIAGYNAREISVSVKYTGYDTAIRVTIKNPYINADTVKEIVNKYEQVSYDEVTGEILQGANTYVRVSYEYGIFEQVSEAFETLAKEAIEKAAEIVEIIPGLFLCSENHCYVVRQENQYGSRIVYNAEALAEYVFKYPQFGNIAV
mgnify:FL=1